MVGLSLFSGVKPITNDRGAGHFLVFLWLDSCIDRNSKDG